MNVKIAVYGKFDKVGEVEVLKPTIVSVPANVPIRWSVKVLWFKVTIVGRATIEAVPE